MIQKHQPEIAILDVNLPGINGLEILEKLQSSPVRTKVILLTLHKELSIFNKAKSLSAKGYVLKEFSTDVLDACINAVLKGETWYSRELDENLFFDKEAHPGGPDLSVLTFAERKILKLIGRQHTTNEIATMLFIAEKTVENHRHNIMKKLQLPPEKNALLVWAVQNMPSK